MVETKWKQANLVRPQDVDTDKLYGECPRCHNMVEYLVGDYSETTYGGVSCIPIREFNGTFYFDYDDYESTDSDNFEISEYRCPRCNGVITYDEAEHMFTRRNRNGN